jgi:enoyl-CoA hydratase/carnithine racemase
VGAGVDLATAADIRLASPDATFCVKEVDLGIVADLGTLHRLRLLVGDGAARDWSLTARAVGAQEAVRAGLVSAIAPDVRAEAFRVAAGLAAKPPRALAGTKAVLLAARDQTVASGLEWVALWNGGGALPSAEVAAALGKAGAMRARL